MMKQLFIKLGVTTLFSLLCSTYLHAQVVTDERMFSFEEPQIPDCISAVQSQLSISDIHYKDGKHSLEWTFEPGAVLQIKKDLKFEKKDPTGKDLYLSAFIVWVYNETSQDVPPFLLVSILPVGVPRGFVTSEICKAHLRKG